MSDELLVGKNVDQYQIKGILGRGEMSVVYRAYQPTANRMVAIKLLPARFMQDSTFFESFQEEAHRLAGLEHPGIVPLYGVGRWEGRPYLAMRCMSGGSLADMLARYGTLSVIELAPIVEQVATALTFAHGQGVLHRNLKPGNILFDEEGNAHLSDFSMVTLRRAISNMTGALFIGTPACVAPEVIRGSSDLTPAVDVYALGVTIFQALAGRPPFQAETTARLMQMHLEETIPSLRMFNASVPPVVDVVMRTALAKEPEDRYASADALAGALTQAAGQKGRPGRDSTAVLGTSAEIPGYMPPPPTPDLPGLGVQRVPATAGAGSNVSSVAAGKPAAETPAPREQRTRNRRTRRTGQRGMPWYTAVLVLLLLLLVWFAAGTLIGVEARRYVNQARLAEIHGTQTPLAATAYQEATWTIQAYIGAFQTATQEALAAIPTATPTLTLTPTTTPTPTSTSTPTPTPTPAGGGGGLIAFVSEQDGDPEICLLDPVTRRVTQITSNTATDDLPAWSPDGTLLAYQSNVLGAGQQHIYTVEAMCNDLPGGCVASILPLTTGIRLDTAPVWSADGSRVGFFSRQYERWWIRSVGADGSNEQDVVQLPGQISLLDWMPDGSFIFFGASVPGPFEILRLPPGGVSTDRVALTNASGAVEFADYSPDGSQVVYQVLIGTHRQIFLADGTCEFFNRCVITRLTNDEYNYLRPRFSPDGSLILVTSDRSGNLDLYIMNLEGEIVHRLTDHPYDEYNGVWQPAAYP